MVSEHPESQWGTISEKTSTWLRKEGQLNRNTASLAKPNVRMCSACSFTVGRDTCARLATLLEQVPVCFCPRPTSEPPAFPAVNDHWDAVPLPESRLSFTPSAADALPSIPSPRGTRWFNVTVALTASSLLCLHSGCLLCDCAWENLLLECH